MYAELTLENPEIAGAAQELDEMFAEADSLEAAKALAERQFLKWCRGGDARTFAEFAPRVRDYDAKPISEYHQPMRVQRLHELMLDSTDCTDGGPQLADVMQILLEAAYNPHGANVQANARALITRLACSYADHLKIGG